MNEAWAIAAGLLAALLVAMEVGFRAGRNAQREEDNAARGQIGAVQGAVLGLLGLLLGFSVAGAAGRFLERQDLITREANAIGTAYLRADVLEEPPGLRCGSRFAPTPSTGWQPRRRFAPG